jgi:hypothetical protein
MKMIDRRDFIKISALAGTSLLTGFTPFNTFKDEGYRSFSLCTNTTILNNHPEFLETIASSGVTDVWLPVFLNGYRPYPMEDILLWKAKIEKKGIAVHSLSVPFGHPSNSLGGDTSFDVPPQHWPRSVDIEGKIYSGTSVHPVVTEENIAVIQKVSQSGFKKLFLDDDFRLARSPGTIGGCFCDWHKKDFTTKYGYNEQDWLQLKQNIKDSEISPVLSNWIEYNCDQLTNSFRAQQAAAPEVALGIMVMYLASEKAGIRLNDYKGSLFRVGELMFEDKSFNPVKGKTDELFSALFHRRFVTPELAFSETTAYPADKLSAKNMAAKLHISTIADIRNTMMMSGLEPFPFTHWETLASAMKKAAAMHQKIAGQKSAGPFKHFWGESSRMVGNDKPFSLFLASGIPFEVTEKPASDGWTFLSDFDAKDVESGKLKSHETTFIHGSNSERKFSGVRFVAENLAEIFAFKHEIIPQLKSVPYVEEDKPVVCAWFPESKTVLLWNLSEIKEVFTLVKDEEKRTVQINGLDAELIYL